jgi:hypothetical protein
VSATIDQANKDDIGLMPDDPMLGEIIARNAETPPEIPVRPATLAYVRPDNFRFRTNVGHRNTEIRLRIPEETGDLDRDVKLKKAFEKWAAREHGGDDKKLPHAKRLSIALKALQMDKELWESENIDAFKFRPIPGRQEATFETKDPRIAAYIRMRIKEPNYVGVVYEDVQAMAVEIDGRTAYMVPADAESRAIVAAHAANGA